MIINSDGNLQYFPNNKPYNFRCKLRQRLNLDGDWMMGLTEVTINGGDKINSSLHIYSNICGETIIDGVYAPLLRSVLARGIENYIFNSPYYTTVVKSEINEIEFSIKTEKGSSAIELKDPVVLVIHFKTVHEILL